MSAGDFGPWIGMLGVAYGLWQRRARRALRGGEAKLERLEVESQRDAATLRRAHDRLVQSERLEAVGRLAGGVAHDFNNQLGLIIGQAELARAATEGLPGVRRRLDQVLAAAQHAALLTRQLLAFSRKQVLEPSILDLNAELRELEPMLERLLGAEVRLDVRLAPVLGKVRADPGQVSQVLINLATNARDAMPAGGTLTIETRDVELDEGYAGEHPPLVPGAYVELRVADDGTGLDPAAREHLFEPFYTTKPEGLGSGLGLSTVYGIVKQSGGYIWVESVTDSGTSFTIQLPRLEEAALAARPASAQPAVAVDSTARTILVAEDLEGLRELICEILADEGYHVLAADSGPAALAAADGFDGPIDLLVTDVIMPGMSGTQLAARLAEARPQTRTLLMSGYTQDEIAPLQAQDAQGLTLLRKPFTRATLLQQIREVLARLPA